AEGPGPEWALLRIVSARRIFAFEAHRFDAMRPPPREQCGTGRHAPRAEISALKTHATRGERVDVRRLHPRPGFGVTADRLVGLIVCENEKDVWRLCGSEHRRGGAKQGEEAD